MRHMKRYGMTREQLAQVAINDHRNAALNPRAIVREPLTMDTYMAARLISTPFCLYDCDRFTDATFAYQGGGRELGVDRIAVLEQWVHPELQPDCTWLFDVPLAVARERLDRTRDQDRFEQEADAFFQRTRAVYLSRAQQQPTRIQRIDATQTIEQIRAQLSVQLKIGRAHV